jgi:DNA primase
MFNIRQLLNDITGADFVQCREEYSVCCPFHSEKNPSFSMRHDGKFFCHTCGVRGSSLFSFISQLYAVGDEMEILDMLFPYTEDNQGPGLTPVVVCPVIDENIKYKLNLEAAKRYYCRDYQDDRVFTSFDRVQSKAHLYLSQRSLFPETLEKFRVAVWEIFDHPIIIPCTFNDVVYGYIQRSIDERVWPKYQTMTGMKKQEHIYGLYPGKKGVALVVEGYMDLMMCWQYGWSEGLYTIMGSAISNDQMRELAAVSTTIIAGFDRDKAGEDATQELLAKAAPYNIPVVRPLWPSKDIAMCTRAEFWDVLSQTLYHLGNKTGFTSGAKLVHFSV